MPSLKEFLPRYECHKKVWGAKIKSLTIADDDSAQIVPDNPDLSGIHIQTGPGWATRFAGTTQDMGYYVLYEDDYESWSPTKPFEGGYTRILGE